MQPPWQELKAAGGSSDRAMLGLCFAECGDAGELPMARQLGRQPRHGTTYGSSRGRWLQETWYINTMKYCSAARKDGTAPLATWMARESIVLREGSQTERDKNRRISLMWAIKQKTINSDTDNSMVT